MSVAMVDSAAKFERWQVNARLAQGTVLARRYCLASWAEHIGDGWTCADWRDVERWLAGRRLGPRARASAVSHVRAFYRWARREGLVVIDPCADVEVPRLPAAAPRPVREHDASRAVGAGRARLEVASALMVYAGLRCCEVAGLAWSDVDLDGGLLYVVGKGGKEASVPIAGPLAIILAGCDSTAGPVIAAAHGGHLRPARVSALIAGHLRSLGINATAHQLRHYAATHVLARCGDVMVVRDFLRHASVATTQVYARLADQRVRDAVAGAW
jgi:integrase